jgi:hypothetical protein
LTPTTVELGYAVGTGERVEIPIRHMVVTGQTQEAGKTTTLEALIERAAIPAIAFLTKRGERAFGEGRRIPPYFREKADWQFVSSVLESILLERMKFERAWIMRVTKAAKTLADVLRNCKEQRKQARRGIDESMYMQLEAYLEIIVPRVARVQWAKTVDLQPGLNICDLSNRDTFPPELQGLVMRSVIEWIYEHATAAITIIPEAWEFVPQSRGSPVKLAAVELIRKGAGLGNYVWLDSQDIGGVDKEILRSCPVWLLGVQRETNEIKRVLDNIPAGVKKPRPADVSMLKKGEFFACFGEHTIRTYVRPKWMDADEAHEIACGYKMARPPPAPIIRADDPWPPDVGVQMIEEELRAKIRADVLAEHKSELTAAEEHGRLKGFEQGYAAAAAAITGKVTGVVKTGEAFVEELRALARDLAARAAVSANTLEIAPPGPGRFRYAADPERIGSTPEHHDNAAGQPKLDRIIHLLETRRTL